MTSELDKIAALQKKRYMVFTERELRVLHSFIAHHAPQGQIKEDLELNDLEARLSTAIELPVDEQEYREGLVALLPEHLQSAGRRLIVYNTGDEHVAVAIWCEVDVFERAKEKHLKIGREQVQEILADIDQRQDAEYGITWSTIDCLLDDLLAAGKVSQIDLDEDE